MPESTYQNPGPNVRQCSACGKWQLLWRITLACDRASEYRAERRCYECGVTQEDES